MRLIFYLWEVVLVLLGQESTVLIPKSYPNLLRIGSRIERLGVQIKRLSNELSITYPFYLSDFSPHFPHRRKKYSSKSLFSLATQYKNTTFEKK